MSRFASLLRILLGSRRGPIITLVVALAGMSAVASVGLASTNASLAPIQTMSACIHEGNAQLRVVPDPAACGADMAVSWSATFGLPTGGQVGDVYTTSDATRTSLVGLPSGGTWVHVLQLSVPPGSYSFTARTGILSNELEEPFHTKCAIQTENRRFDFAQLFNHDPRLN